MLTSRLHCVLIVCLALLGANNVTIAQQLPATQPPQGANPAAQNQTAAAPSTVSAAIPSYPDTPKGLEDLMNEMLKLEKKHDSKALAPYVESLELPNAGAWFRATFGDEIGKQLADSYDRTLMNFPFALPDILEQLNSKHLSSATAVVFTDSCNAEASMDEYAVLLSRKNGQPLYDVRFASSSPQRATLRYFAYASGAFRFVGNFRLDMPNTEIVQVNEETMKRNIIKNPRPAYPQSALMERISGVVMLRAIVGINGQICSLQVISGHPVLAAAALAGIGQRRYSPYLLKGKPVSVDTTITVSFDIQD